jgi:single-strand DNA-binding protein
MRTINRIELLGNLGTDPDLRYTQAGKEVAKFRLATTAYNPNGEDKTEWHNLIAFGKTAEIAAKYLAKGNLVYLVGHNHTRSWEDKGHTNWITEVIVDEIVLLPQKQ